MLSNNLLLNPPSFIIIDDVSEISHEGLPNLEAFSKSTSFLETFQHNQPQIIIIDSTEDESDKSIVKLQLKNHKIKKNKTNAKKIGLCKQKDVLKYQLFEKNQADASTTADTSSIKESEPISNFQQIFPLVAEKNINIGGKYQASLPKFSLKSAGNNDYIQEILKNKVWKPDAVDQKEFSECKKLMETILELNYFTDDFVCQFLALNNYNVEKTIDYCLTNKSKLQSQIIDSYIPNEIGRAHV